MHQRLRQLARGFSTTVLKLCAYAFLTLISILPLLLVVSIYLLLDYLGGISLFPTAVLVVWLLGVACSFWIVILWECSGPSRWAIPALVLVLLFAVTPADWNHRKPFFRAFYAIEPGMTIEQVDRLMAPALASATAVKYPVRGWRYKTEPGDLRPRLPRPDPTSNADTLYYRPWDRSDIFSVHFVDDRVTARHFDPD
ncbi:MAG: hypothetical protein M3Q65_21875 [Chloroflexota bacterium]|nr:hypothetical protein [Chloroflexota bacterium]